MHSTLVSHHPAGHPDAAPVGLDVMARLVAAPARADLPGILDGVRTAAEPRSKLALVRAAARDTQDAGILMLAELAALAPGSGLAEAAQAAVLDALAALMRDLDGTAAAEARRRRLVSGLAYLMRVATVGRAGPPLREALRRRFLEAARGASPGPAAAEEPAEESPELPDAA